MKSRLLLIFSGVAYYLLLILIYILYIVPVHGYTGLTFHPIPLPILLSLALISLIPLLWMPINISRPSDLISWWLYLCITIPSSFIIVVSADRDSSNLFMLPISLLLAFIIFDFTRLKSKFKIKPYPLREPVFVSLVVLSMIVFTAVTLVVNNFSINLSFDTIYERRLDAREMVAASSIVAYAIATLNNVLNPLCMMLVIIYKRKFFLFLLCISIIVNFSFSGEKATLFSPLLILFTYFIVTNKKSGGTFLFLNINLLIIVSFLEYALLKSDFLVNNIVRRQFIIPSKLTFDYWDFFSNHPVVMMSDSLLKIFFEPRYNLTMPHLIGYEYYGSLLMNGNANIWAGAFGHFGYFGFLLVSIFAGWIAAVYDSLGKGNNFIFACAFAAQIGIVWTNGNLQTSILSDGVAVSIIILYFLPRTLDVKPEKVV